ncbi:hypothetical protein NDU88_008471 [Pleurodeles waltl]|uniref:Uncharacterized protein n=1 Tax=Pleurodeles waltl TaxID=8319 RepID=A0AAV7QSW0_PLEWA|nr:hypothetical protein NDU88_008471 [Pleurodeles waltl]
MFGRRTEPPLPQVGRWRCLSNPVGPKVVASDVLWPSSAGKRVLWAHSSLRLDTPAPCGVALPVPDASLLHGRRADVRTLRSDHFSPPVVVAAGPRAYQWGPAVTSPTSVDDLSPSLAVSPSLREACSSSRTRPVVGGR